MNGAAVIKRQNRIPGLTLVEMQISIVIAGILIVGLFVSVIVGTSDTLRDSLQDKDLAEKINVAFTGIGYRLRQGTETASQTFAIYASRTSPNLVSDGNTGACLLIPRSGSSNEFVYAENGALTVERQSDGHKDVLVPSGVSAVRFTADMTGSPAARSGAVCCSVDVVSLGTTFTLSTMFLPRDRYDLSGP